jgi:hypothetical protein
MTRRGCRNQLRGSSSAGRIVGEKAGALEGSKNMTPPSGAPMAPSTGVAGWILSICYRGAVVCHLSDREVSPR